MTAPPVAASARRVLSLIPPMTQLNTPYPSTAYLTGFLRSQGIAAEQRDLALGLVLRLLSRDGVQALKTRYTGAIETAAARPSGGIATARATRMDETVGRLLPNPALLQKRLAMTGRDWTLGKYGMISAGIATVLALLLALQAAVAWRDLLAAHVPAAAPALTRWCEWTGAN